jgi:FkbM family methyltransferase
LAENVALNAMTNIVTTQAAVCEHPGSRTFFLSNGHDSGSSSLVPAHDFSGATAVVDAISLDSYCEEHRIARVDCLKLDIEGAELDALRGARRLLASARPIVLIEYHQEVAARAGVSLDSISDLLRSCDYTLRRITSRGLVPLERRDLRGTAAFNVLARPHA